MNNYAQLKIDYQHLPFTQYFDDVYSENGEDGVLLEICNRLGLLAKVHNYAVEFGAWDGIKSSNTFRLVRDYNFHAIYLESDQLRFQKLLNTCKEFPSITPICKLVSHIPKSKDSLDSILMTTPAPLDFDILSIDIDSYDLEVWESLELYIPLIVVIEINSSIPPGIISKHNLNNHGNSFTATVNIATQKNYTLACHTGNLIFVHNSMISRLNLPQKFIESPESLFLFKSPWMLPDIHEPIIKRKILSNIKLTIKTKLMRGTK
jgi:hypothetical protein